MGFKARARKFKPKDEGKEKEDESKSENEVPCGIKGCGNFADKHLGGIKVSSRKSKVELECVRNVIVF